MGNLLGGVTPLTTASNPLAHLVGLDKQTRDAADVRYRELVASGYAADSTTYRLATAQVRDDLRLAARRAFEAHGGQCWPCRDSGRQGRRPCSDCGGSITLEEAVAAANSRQVAGDNALAAAQATLPYTAWREYSLTSWVAAGGNQQGGLYQTVAAYVRSFQPGMGATMLLLGKSSRGKTGLAVAGMLDLASRFALPCAFISASDLIDDYLQNWQQAKLYQRWQRAHIVVLDDLGMQRNFKGFDAAGFFSSLLTAPSVAHKDQRVPKSLIITSNRLINPDSGEPSLMEQFGDLGERIIERLFERSGAGNYLVELPDDTAEVNLRLKEREQCDV